MSEDGKPHVALGREAQWELSAAGEKLGMGCAGQPASPQPAQILWLQLAERSYFMLGSRPILLHLRGQCPPSPVQPCDYHHVCPLSASPWSGCGLAFPGCRIITKCVSAGISQNLWKTGCLRLRGILEAIWSNPLFKHPPRAGRPFPHQFQEASWYL